MLFHTFLLLLLPFLELQLSQKRHQPSIVVNSLLSLTFKSLLFICFKVYVENNTENYYKYLSFEESNDILPDKISKYILKSDFKLHNGYLKVAGLFFSKKK